jgi:hypothetical protein
LLPNGTIPGLPPLDTIVNTTTPPPSESNETVPTPNVTLPPPIPEGVGVEILSTYHCSGACRANQSEPTQGKFGYFACETANLWAGTPLETGSEHTILVDNHKLYDVKIWTGAANWPGSDGQNDCAARRHPAVEASEGDFEVGDTFVFVEANYTPATPPPPPVAAPPPPVPEAETTTAPAPVEYDVCIYGDPSACRARDGGEGPTNDELVGVSGMSCPKPGVCAEGHFSLWTGRPGEMSHVCIPDTCFDAEHVCTYGNMHACNENPGGVNDCASPP